MERGPRPTRVPDYVRAVVEQVAFEARADKRVDQRSGVSQRLPISLLELAVSNAEQRAALTQAPEIVVRIEDVLAALPGITGKLELEYEGELQGADTVALEMIRRAVAVVFDQGGALKLSGNQTAAASKEGFATVPGLVELAEQVGLAERGDDEMCAAGCEFILEGLTAHHKITKDETIGYNRQPTRRREPPSGPSINLG